MTLSDRFSEPPRSSRDESAEELEDQLSLLFNLIEGNSSPKPSTLPEAADSSPTSDPTSESRSQAADDLVVNWVEVEAALPTVEPESAIAPQSTLAPESTNPPAPNADGDPESEIFAQLRELIVGSDNESEEQVKQLSHQIRTLHHQISDSDALIELLMPVVAELLDRKVQQSREDVCQALYPIADGIIDQRARQDRDAMSGVLAKIIPAAISQEIRDAPHEIVKAIAPAMGAAIREQVRLDRNSIAQVLAPEMGRAIKQQVELERDAMVDALYPIIGGIIKRYIAEAIQEINRKLSETLTSESVKRKVRARLQGVSEAELIFTESMPARIKAVFLIHKSSGLVIAQTHLSDALTLDAEMIGGMLTAIRSFVKECIAPSGESELNEIEYGDSKILLEVAGYCYLAVVIQGTPPSDFIEKVRGTLGYIIQKYGDAIEDFDGDPDTLPEAVPPLIEGLMEIEDKSVKPKAIPWMLLGVAGAIALAIGIPWHLHQRQQAFNHQLERSVLSALYDNPELSVYRFNVRANREQLTLQGRVPSPTLRDKATTLVTPFLASKQQLNNRILAVDIPPDPDRVRAEVKRVEALLNQESGMAINARYETLPNTGELPTRGKVILSGMVKSTAAIQKATRAFEQIPGISNVSTAFGLPSINISTRIYFAKDSTQIQSIDLKVKIESVVRILNQYPDLQIEIIGYSPPSEGEISSQLGFRRATAVRTALLERGITSDRLQVRGLTGGPSDVGTSAPDWLRQCVRFEVLAPTLDPNAVN
ncbi:BON domain-containing protein [Oscillatoria sp. FACHB-1406]|uniref:OmpA family protein n=1 Tax=Oscillatoria sp. FACHB-1406 TaxID=2692846 RepID=UPI001686A1D0|nr:BON domain-containing protein [Oscillatoria sp. FACHB-1406]MBD2577096.1 BON domain-containing protein [Oscillatoria sp. FACHB-1406]